MCFLIVCVCVLWKSVERADWSWQVKGIIKWEVRKLKCIYSKWGRKKRMLGLKKIVKLRWSSPTQACLPMSPVPHGETNKSKCTLGHVLSELAAKQACLLKPKQNKQYGRGRNLTTQCRSPIQHIVYYYVSQVFLLVTKSKNDSKRESKRLTLLIC